VKSGCSERGIVVGHETILGHETTVIQTGPPGFRLRIWMAPDLACYALKITEEAQASDGAYRLEYRKEALRVTMNP
jgi:hypothetical protein